MRLRVVEAEERRVIAGRMQAPPMTGAAIDDSNLPLSSKICRVSVNVPPLVTKVDARDQLFKCEGDGIVIKASVSTWSPSWTLLTIRFVRCGVAVGVGDRYHDVPGRGRGYA
jgi:hypothetical protein